MIPLKLFYIYQFEMSCFYLFLGSIIYHFCFSYLFFCIKLYLKKIFIGYVNFRKRSKKFFYIYIFKNKFYLYIYIFTQAILNGMDEISMWLDTNRIPTKEVNINIYTFTVLLIFFQFIFILASLLNFYCNLQPL